MTLVKANRQLRGTYGTLTPGQAKHIEDDLALELADRGLVELLESDDAAPFSPVEETKPENLPVRSGVTFEYPSPSIETKSAGE